MADYKKMYTKLFNTVTDTINLLQTAQADTEEIYMEQEEPSIALLDSLDEDK